jgi:hypothetical protein
VCVNLKEGNCCYPVIARLLGLATKKTSSIQLKLLTVSFTQHLRFLIAKSAMQETIKKQGMRVDLVIIFMVLNINQLAKN